MLRMTSPLMTGTLETAHLLKSKPEDCGEKSVCRGAGFFRLKTQSACQSAQSADPIHLGWRRPPRPIGRTGLYRLTYLEGRWSHSDPVTQRKASTPHSRSPCAS